MWFQMTDGLVQDGRRNGDTSLVLHHREIKMDPAKMQKQST